MADHLRVASANEVDEQLSSHGIEIQVPDDCGNHATRRVPVKHKSAPAPQDYPSPARHHRRVPSKSKGVKETLNARSHYGSSDDDGASVHRINQYIIRQEIGRGSFGAVHLAVDQFGNEFAVKEFSKSRLRKRAQSSLLRRPLQGRRPGHLAAGFGFNSPLHRRVSSDRLGDSEDNNSLSLIKEEIAIMKKLDHHNLVSLIEVLDDPDEDSLYMVLEMCKKGVVMKVGLDERAEPYEEEPCRCWFRDMILGIEYLHAQGIIHRDIKPDNCLVTHDDVLKIVDFGVSEMFEKESDMATAKSAGSPAFMPPELCVAKHGQVSGRAADIWSMGITLYCLRYGHIPFEKHGMLELYESIRGDPLLLDDENDENFADLMRQMLEKDPEKRITMAQMRAHPWVTRDGTDPLLSSEENCADIVGPVTDAEMENAITGNMVNLMTVMKAVKRFKRLLMRKRPHLMEGIFGRESKLVAPPASIERNSMNTSRSRPLHRALVAEEIHRDTEVDDEVQKPSPHLFKMATLPADPPPKSGVERPEGETEAHYKQRLEAATHRPFANTQRTLKTPKSAPDSPAPIDTAKGHAHDPLEDTLFLDIGTGEGDDSASEAHGDGIYQTVSESPPAVEMNIYEQAYQDEMKRILDKRGEVASIYLNRRVEHREDIKEHSSILGHDSLQNTAKRLQGATSSMASSGLGGFAHYVKHVQTRGREKDGSTDSEEPLLAAPSLETEKILASGAGAAAASTL